MEEERTDRGSSKWRKLKHLLSFKSLVCCAGSLCRGSPSHSNHMTLTEEYQENSHPDYSHDYYSQESQQQLVPNPTNLQEISPDLHCLLLHQNYSAITAAAAAAAAAASEEMNLAAALAAERQFRAAMAAVTETETPTPARIPLMRLLEEKEREEKEKSSSTENEAELGMSSCCVCMGRNKGSAFIPCGHTFCRVCSRELWVSRGACPLCNRSILEILDIF